MFFVYSLIFLLKRLHEALSGAIRLHKGLFQGSLKGYFGGILGSFGKSFEGLLEGVLGYIKAKVLVMLASSGA